MERRIEYLAVEDLRPDERNPKRHDIPLLGRSMQRFGYIEPVVLDERTGRIVSGHGRVETALAGRAAGSPPPEGITVDERGRWRLPVVRGWASADDAEAAAALVALNRTVAVGGWDDAALYAVLDGLGADNLDGVGYSPEDLEVLDRFVAATDWEGGGTDPYAEWVGMPDFDGEATERPYRSLLVHLADEDAAEDFNERLGGALPDKARSMWWPPRPRRNTTGLHYIQGGAE